MIRTFFGFGITEINTLNQLIDILKDAPIQSFLTFWSDDGDFLSYRFVHRDFDNFRCYENASLNITLALKRPILCNNCLRDCKAAGNETKVKYNKVMWEGLDTK